MKKLKVFVILTCFLVMTITGCGKVKKEKVIICNSSRIEKHFTINEEITFGFNVDNDTFESYKQKLIIDYGSNTDFAQDMYKKCEETCDELKDYSGASCIVNKDSEIITVELEILLPELTDGSALSKKFKPIHYEQAKKNLEDAYPNYICEEQK